MDPTLLERLRISNDQVEQINAVLLDPNQEVMRDFLEVVSKYGTPEEINRKAQEARRLPHLLKLVEQTKPENLAQLEWLTDQRDRRVFVSVDEYRRQVLGEKASRMQFQEDFAVTLELSGCQYFEWVIEVARRAIAQRSLMPGRFIRVRKMKEQEADGDLPAFAAAMQIIGASYVETLDTKGTDGSNIHLGGPETITGYFGGIGEPNEHALGWLDEYLYYYTNYGVRQVLNINPGTVILGYLLHRLGVDIEFKISVYMGNDNPYAALWTLIGAKLFARQDGSSPLIGFNWSNSIDNRTMEITAEFRKELGFENIVRFEHHITETWKSIVIQPYNRRSELVEIADHVANISAKHEGGEPELEPLREHPTDILDYFRDRAEIVESGDWECLTQNFIDKFDATNETARALTQAGLSFVAARNLHYADQPVAA
jgi:antitoxin component of MazEF toxin-antitoxin module